MIAARFARLDHALRTLIPFLSAFLLLLFGITSAHSTSDAAIMPPFLFMAIYYWSIHRPDLMPGWLVFLFGLGEDSLTGSMFGLHALLFLVAGDMLRSQRRFFVSGSFLMLWWGFALTAILLLTASWGLSALATWTLLPLGPALWRAFFGIACFPPVAWGFIKLHRALVH